MMPVHLTPAEAWRNVKHDYRAFLLTSPEGHAVYKLADLRITELAGQVAELKAQLADAQGVTVLRCLERDAGRMMAQAANAAYGTMLKATDTARTWVRVQGGWDEQPQ